MAANATYLVKVNERGLLTLEMPQMVGKYVVIEQSEEKLTITPLDLERDPKCAALARRGQQWTMLGAQCHEAPYS